jgi:hypothetical protein
MSKYYIIKITGGTSPGPYTIYYNSSLGPIATIYPELTPATNLTLTQLTGPTGVMVRVPDNSSIIPTTQWVQGAISSASTGTTVTLTCFNLYWNAAGNYTQFSFQGFPNWTAYSWIFSTPIASKTTQSYTNLGNTPCTVPNVTPNGSFLLITGTGITQTYSATSSTMVTYCSGFQQNYTVTSTSNAAILSIISSIGASVLAPVYISNNLNENTSNCPPTGTSLTGYVMIQMTGDGRAFAQPTMKLVQLIA